MVFGQDLCMQENVIAMIIMWHCHIHNLPNEGGPVATTWHNNKASFHFCSWYDCDCALLLSNMLNCKYCIHTGTWGISYGHYLVANVKDTFCKQQQHCPPSFHTWSSWRHWSSCFLLLVWYYFWSFTPSLDVLMTDFLNKHTTTPFLMLHLLLFCFTQINHDTRILLICLLEQHTILGSPVPAPIKSLVQTSIPPLQNIWTATFTDPNWRNHQLALMNTHLLLDKTLTLLFILLLEKNKAITHE